MSPRYLVKPRPGAAPAARLRDVPTATPGDRHSEDPQLRLEWHVNRIRVAVEFLAVVTAIGLVFGAIGALAILVGS